MWTFKVGYNSFDLYQGHICGVNIVGDQICQRGGVFSSFLDSPILITSDYIYQ